MENANKHLDAAPLLPQAQKLDARVDHSTVFRTLQWLKRHGLIDELDLMHIHGEGHDYERKLNRDHVHMACLRCGKIMAFVRPYFREAERASGKGLQLPRCGFRFGNRRLRRAVPGSEKAKEGLPTRSPRLPIKKRPGLVSQGRSAALPRNCQTTPPILRIEP
jgi:hypothetical protein